MADQYLVVIEGLENLSSLDDLPKRTVRAAQIAVNDAARSGRTLAAKRILSEIKFPSDYVAPRNGRLSISQFATANNLEAKITARTRATSLARFALDASPAGGAKRREGVRVEVEPGRVRRLPGAFLIRLRAGTASLDTKSNMGLAVRTKNGRPPPGYKPTRLGENLWLLYGPSVAQVMYSERNRGGVATDISPEIARKLEDEFWRQMDMK